MGAMDKGSSKIVVVAAERRKMGASTTKTKGKRVSGGRGAGRVDPTNGSLSVREEAAGAVDGGGSDDAGVEGLERGRVVRGVGELLEQVDVGAVEDEEVRVGRQEGAERHALDGARQVVALLQGGPQFVERRDAVQVVEALQHRRHQRHVVRRRPGPPLRRHVVLGHQPLQSAPRPRRRLHQLPLRAHVQQRRRRRRLAGVAGRRRREDGPAGRDDAGA
mmetsp:Transcript_5242/g.16496  ORF Transcript_5242/g.16496 Transcript_5242/m.16496 type:complete len:219 (+) Transcript_5242:665-1321(+)